MFKVDFVQRTDDSPGQPVSDQAGENDGARQNDGDHLRHALKENPDGDLCSGYAKYAAVGKAQSVIDRLLIDGIRIPRTAAFSFFHSSFDLLPLSVIFHGTLVHEAVVGD